MKRKLDKLSSSPEDGEHVEQHPADSLIIDKAATRESTDNSVKAHKLQPTVPRTYHDTGEDGLVRAAANASERPVAVVPTGVTVIDDDADDANAQNRMQRLLRGPRCALQPQLRLRTLDTTRLDRLCRVLSTGVAGQAYHTACPA